jgi:hypothetical protein
MPFWSSVSLRNAVMMATIFAGRMPSTEATIVMEGFPLTMRYPLWGKGVGRRPHANPF